jgi:hypothetical protein
LSLRPLRISTLANVARFLPDVFADIQCTWNMRNIIMSYHGSQDISYIDHPSMVVCALFDTISADDQPPEKKKYHGTFWISFVKQ